MTRRDRREALEHILATAPDWPTAARLTAAHERQWRGFVGVHDREPHYLCQIGLNDVLPAHTQDGD